jgi:hypothetical protein
MPIASLVAPASLPSDSHIDCRARSVDARSTTAPIAPNSYGFPGNPSPGFSPKKSNGRITKSCHITGITGQSSARGT